MKNLCGIVRKYYLSIMVETFTLSGHDKQIIKDIVSHYVSGDRVKILRSIFKHEVSFEHYIYLGQIIGAEACNKMSKEVSGKVFRMETLRLLN